MQSPLYVLQGRSVWSQFISACRSCLLDNCVINEGKKHRQRVQFLNVYFTDTLLYVFTLHLLMCTVVKFIFFFHVWWRSSFLYPNAVTGFIHTEECWDLNVKALSIGRISWSLNLHRTWRQVSDGSCSHWCDCVIKAWSEMLAVRKAHIRFPKQHRSSFVLLTRREPIHIIPTVVHCRVCASAVTHLG